MTATLMIRINIRLFNSFLFCSLCSSFSLSRWFLFLFICRWISLCPIPCVCRNEYLIETIQSHAMPLNWNRFISFIRLSCSLSWRSFFSGAFLSVIGRNGDNRHFFSLKTLFLLHSSVTAIVLIKYQRFLHSFFSFSQICRIMVQFQFDDTHTHRQTQRKLNCMTATAMIFYSTFRLSEWTTNSLVFDNVFNHENDYCRLDEIQFHLILRIKWISPSLLLQFLLVKSVKRIMRAISSIPNQNRKFSMKMCFFRWLCLC